MEFTSNYPVFYFIKGWNILLSKTMDGCLTGKSYMWSVNLNFPSLKKPLRTKMMQFHAK